MASRDCFFKKFWLIIKGDMMAVLLCILNENSVRFHKLNRALLSLVPKKVDALEVRDFHPISLVHSISKLTAKALSACCCGLHRACPQRPTNAH